MNKIVKRYIRLFIGLFLCAVGMTLTINAELGYSPWDVFHQGIGNILGTTIGTSNIIVGIFILTIEVTMKQKPGIGTLCNMTLIGIFMNIIMGNNLLPKFENVYVNIGMILIGMIIIGIGSYLYISSGFGAGPRDGLMLLLLLKTDKSIRFIRNSMEITVLVIGYLLGGPVGIGTVIISFGLGYAIQLVFKMFDFEPKDIVHRQLGDEVEAVKSLFKKQ